VYAYPTLIIDCISMPSRDKRTFPLTVLRELKQFKQSIKPPFSVDQKHDSLVMVRDTRFPDFWFMVSGYNINSMKNSYVFQRKPSSGIDLTASNAHSVVYANLVSIFDRWQELCNEWDEIDSPFEDDEVKRAEEEIFNDWKVLDDDAESATFSLPQQVFLIAALDRIKESVKIADEDIITASQKEDLVDSLAAIQDDLPTETKNGILRRLSAIAAKARKASVKVGNFLLKEFTKELLKEGAKHLIKMDPRAVQTWLQAFGENIRGLLH
jgi:hypothetical protein